MIKLVKFVFFACICIILITFFYVEYWASNSSSNNRNIKISIEYGIGSNQISRVLKKSQTLPNSFLFYIYINNFTNSSKKLKSGCYIIPANSTPNKIIYILDRGFQKKIKFTIPEGSNKQDIVNILTKNCLEKRNIIFDIITSSPLQENIKIPTGTPGGIEGYLFPETYIFQSGAIPLSIFKHMHNELLNKITPEMDMRMQQVGLNFHEVLTLASLLEKETSFKFEKKIIASVFINRLKFKMKLQTDPTVIYGIRDFSKKITKKDLDHNHKYNTYMYYGLPPGPIDSPGLDSINAVLWPAKSNFLYFVSKKNGMHEFCRTYTCHLAAIKKWQKSN